MPDNIVCPESTIESANRRNFIKKAAIATAAVGIGSTALGKSLIVPESNAASAACVTVTTATKNKVDSLAVWSSCHGLTDAACCPSSFNPSISFVSNVCCCNSLEIKKKVSGPVVLINGNTLSSGPCGLLYSVLSVRNSNTCHPVAISGAACGYPSCSCSVAPPPGGVGIVGSSITGIGVMGTAFDGVGICGKVGCGSTLAGTGVRGTALNAISIPVVAKGADCQSADLQRWQVACTVKSVVNNQGWLGIGTSNPVNPLCISGKGAITGQLGIGTTTPATTLQVKGSISANVTTQTGPYNMNSSDFAVLANAGVSGFTVTLPPAGTAQGMIVFVKKIDTSTHAVKVSANSGDKIEGSSSKSLTKKFESLTLISDGSHSWYVLSNAT
jgi:hypothetical protein